MSKNIHPVDIDFAKNNRSNSFKRYFFLGLFFASIATAFISIILSILS